MVDPMENVHPYTQHDGFVLRGINLRTWMATLMMGARRAQNTFMEPAQAAKLAVQDADALIKELNK